MCGNVRACTGMYGHARVCAARLLVDLVDSVQHLARHLGELRAARQPLAITPHTSAPPLQVLLHVLLHLAEEQGVLADARHRPDEQREHLVRACDGKYKWCMGR